MDTKEVRDRKQKVIKILRFARAKSAQKIIGRLSPELLQIITEEPELLELPQEQNDSRVAGLYRIRVYGKDYYIGESGNVFFRLAEHIYNYIKEPAVFGMPKFDLDIPCSFDVAALHCCSKEIREAIESNLINKLHPLMQYTAQDDPAYGRDKFVPDGETRASIRPDICVFREERARRFRLLQEEMKEK